MAGSVWSTPPSCKKQGALRCGCARYISRAPRRICAIQVLIWPFILRFMGQVSPVLCLIISRHDGNMLLPKGEKPDGRSKDEPPDGCPHRGVSVKGVNRMAVNAQSILETVQRNAQKKIPTNKIKRAAVPDLSMYGIPSAGTTTAGTSTVGTAKPTVAKPNEPAPIAPNKNSLTTGVNATASPIMAAPTCEPQSSFLPRQEAAQGQVYPELEQDELVEDEALVDNSPASTGINRAARKSARRRLNT